MATVLPSVVRAITTTCSPPAQRLCGHIPEQFRTCTNPRITRTHTHTYTQNTCRAQPKIVSKCRFATRWEVVAQNLVMRRNSQTHARRTSQCVSIPHHTTFAYEVMVMIIDRLRCRDPPTTPSYAKDGDVHRVGTIVASLDAATIRCGTIGKSSTWQRRISKHEILAVPSVRSAK